MSFGGADVRRRVVERLFLEADLSATERGYLESVGLEGVYVGALVALGASVQEAEQEVLLLKQPEEDTSPTQDILPFHLGDDDDQEC